MSVSQLKENQQFNKDWFSSLNRDIESLNVKMSRLMELIVDSKKIEVETKCIEEKSLISYNGPSYREWLVIYSLFSLNLIIFSFYIGS